MKLAPDLDVDPWALDPEVDGLLADPRAEDLDRPADADDVADLIARDLSRRGFLTVALGGR